jgi:uncharacterized protein with HEPN domain
VSRRDDAWLTDIVHAVDVIHEYVTERSLADGLIYDACRARLIEIGEAVKNIDRDLLAAVPTVRWRAPGLSRVSKGVGNRKHTVGGVADGVGA